MGDNNCNLAFEIIQVWLSGKLFLWWLNMFFDNNKNEKMYCVCVSLREDLAAVVDEEFDDGIGVAAWEGGKKRENYLAFDAFYTTVSAFINPNELITLLQWT